MADATTPALRSVHIQADRDGGRPFVLHPDDDDLFVRTGRQVIDACRLGISIDVWLEELTSLAGELRAWATERSTKVRACYLTTRSSRVVAFVAPTSPNFDFDLADELAVLNTALLRKFNVGMIELHQVPWGELDRFLDTETARLVYGEHPTRPPQAVGA